MHRRTFLTALLGAAGAATGLAVATRAEAATAIKPADLGQAPEPAAKPAATGAADTLPEGAELQNVQYRRRTYYRRRVYRRPVVRWRPARRRQVCRVTRNRWGRVRRVCTWR